MIMALQLCGVANGQSTTTSNSKVNKWVQHNNGLRFLENKGQMADMQNKPVNGLLFKTSAAGVDMYVTTSGLSYVFVQMQEHEKGIKPSKKGNLLHNDDDSMTVKYCRADMELIGADIRKENIVKEGKSENRTDYYLGGICPDGILNVYSYEKLTINGIYPGIDWVLHTGSKGLEYDFIVHPGANPSLIKLRYKWTDKPVLQSDGSVGIKTPMGIITEGIPVSYIESEKTSVPTNYILRNNEIGFKVANYNTNEILTIDPTLTWGTYYPGGGYNDVMGMQDDGVNVWVTGEAQSVNFPTINPGGGAYFQDTIGTTSSTGTNAFIMQFDTSGVLKWATYYGGNGGEEGLSIYSDNISVWVTGSTASTNFPTLNPGGGAYFQAALANINSGTNAFILQFSTSGIRKWATFYGGNGLGGGQSDWGNSIQSDGKNVWVTGQTASTNFPTFNPGGGAYFQSVLSSGALYNAFVLQFNTLGVCEWATYYGDFDDGGNSIFSDGTNTWVTGFTYSANFPTFNPGGGAYYQGSLGDTNQAPNAFILQFSNTGVRKWATYYGGKGTGSTQYQGDQGNSIQSDGKNVWVTGQACSPNFPTFNPGGGAYFQGTLAAISPSPNAFILEFNTSGKRKWATYYGGSGLNGDIGFSIQSDSKSIWVCGSTSSTDFPAYNPGCSSFFQNTLGSASNHDVFILQFDTSGIRKWATYYGSDDENDGSYVSSDGTNIFVSGDSRFDGNYPLLNPGAGAYYYTSLDGTEDVFMGRLCISCGASANLTISPSVGICIGDSTKLIANGVTSYAWSPSIGLSSANIFDPIASPTVTTTYTVTGSVSGCIGNTKDSVVVTVNPKPIGAISALSSVCIGISTTLTASGGTSYIWNTGATTNSIFVSPASGTKYSVAIIQNGCADTVSEFVTVNPKPIVTACCDTAIEFGQNVELTSSGGGSYLWSPANGLNCNTCPNPTASPNVNTTYTLIVTSDSGCSASTIVTVDISCGTIFIPDAFSPNADGQNDILYVRGMCIKTIEFIVFDRWGNKVFETNDQGVGWNGNYKGEAMNSGTYVYYVNATMNDGTNFQEKGNVTLVR